MCYPTSHCSSTVYIISGGGVIATALYVSLKAVGNVKNPGKNVIIKLYSFTFSKKVYYA